MDDHDTPPEEAAENPRTTRMREAVLTAVVDLVVSEGAGAVTALRVADRACVARSTIYQHWPTSAALIRDAIDRIITPNAQITITGDVQIDLNEALFALRERLERRPFRIWVATLLNHANANPEFVETQVRFVMGVLRPLRDVVEDAVKHGDLQADLDLDAATTRLAAPVLTEHVLLHRPATDASVSDAVNAFLTDHAASS